MNRAGQLRATITTILNASAVSEPSIWLEMLSDVVFAAAPSASAAAGSGSEADVGDAHGDDDEDEKNSDTATSASENKWAGRSSGVKPPRLVREVLTAPNVRTRHYAGTACLNQPSVATSKIDSTRASPCTLEFVLCGVYSSLTAHTAPTYTQLYA